MTSNKLLIQKHRAKMAEEGNARIEVTLGRGLITQARALAQQRRVRLWEVVQDALLAYLAAGNRPKSQQEAEV